MYTVLLNLHVFAYLTFISHWLEYVWHSFSDLFFIIQSFNYAYEI